MEVAKMKKLLESTQGTRNKFNEKYRTSKNYYRNENDITIKNHGESRTKEDDACKKRIIL